MAENGGAQIAPMLAAVNQIADAIAEEWPHVLVDTFACKSHDIAACVSCVASDIQNCSRARRCQHDHGPDKDRAEAKRRHPDLHGRVQLRRATQRPCERAHPHEHYRVGTRGEADHGLGLHHQLPILADTVSRLVCARAQPEVSAPARNTCM